MVEHTTQVQIRWSDVDPAGIVFYPRFFEWYDLGCEALFASLGMPSDSGGVAYFAHIGGFAAGIVLVALLGGMRRPPRPRALPDRDWRM